MINGFYKLIGIVFCLLVISGCASQLGNSKNSYKLADGTELNVNKNDVHTLYQLGKEYQDKEQYTEAIEVYEKVLELKPDYYDAYNGLGVVYSILGEHELATQLIGEAVRLAPLASYLHNNLGYAYMKQGRTSEAAGAFQRSLQIDPNNASARANLMKAYQSLGCVEDKPCGQWQTPEYRQ